MLVPNLYTLTLSPKQAGVMMRALDLFSRVHMGQLAEVETVLREYAGPRGLDWRLREHIGSTLGALERLVGPENGGYYGISHSLVSDDARVATDIQQVVRHRLAWDRTPDGGITVDFDTPMHLSKEPLPLCERLNADGKPERYPAGPVGTVRLCDDLAAEIGTDDLREAVKRIRAWKVAHHA